MSLGVSIILAFALVFVNAYFSLSKTALMKAKKPLLLEEAQDGDKRAARAASVSDNPEQLLASVQVVISLAGLFAAVVAAIGLSEPFAAWMEHFELEFLSLIAPGLAPIFITLAVSYFSIVIGELIPRRIALSNVERIAKAVAGPLLVVEKIVQPMVWLTSSSAQGFAKLFRIKDTEDHHNVSEEEIKYLVTDAEELLDDEKRMIHEIIDLGDTLVREVMTPRVDMIFVEDIETVEQALDRMRGTGYSRLPVYHEDYDNVVGIVYFKDLISPLMDKKEQEPVSKYINDVMFIPETKEIYPLLSEMQTNRQQLAIVVDEYGGTDGLITIEDILEEIVGEIIDEADPEDRYFTLLSENEWLVDGRYSCDDAVEIGWPVEESEDYETIAGWLMSMLDSVPKVGEELMVDDYSFRIQSMRRRRILSVRVKLLSGAEVEAAKTQDENNEEDVS